MSSDPAEGAPDRIANLLENIPFARTLGIEYELGQEGLVTRLAFSEKLIGNVSIRALHGGAIASFLELTAMLEVFLAAGIPRPPRPINVTIDYLRQGQAKPLLARAFILKMGKRITSVRAEAWHEDAGVPVSALTAHFMLSE